MNEHSSEVGEARQRDALRKLPGVDALLRQSHIAELLDEHPRSEVLAAIRTLLDRRRDAILRGAGADEAALSVGRLALDVREILHERRRPALRRVINATGIVLHTNLGRAPLAAEAVEAVADIAGGYCNLEYDLSSGHRGDRHALLRELLCELTGAEDALVVNNNAAATFLALHALAGSGRSDDQRDGVVVSRGQLVEIGGSYRLPDIMAAAGCRMVEVGTTNRTRLSDYAAAIDQHTAALLRVHTSNYRITGFSAAVGIARLVELAREQSAPPVVIDDLGSGLLTEQAAGRLTELAAFDEPNVCDSIAAGADLALFSGDKLLGGPQAGLIVGTSAITQRLRRDPLMRALRPGKLTVAALEATLRLYRDPEKLVERLPARRLLEQDEPTLRSRAEALVEEFEQRVPNAELEIVADESFAGGGTLPALALPTCAVAVRVPACDADALAALLRSGEVPVVARIRDERLLLDCRTISDQEIPACAAALAEAGKEIGAE